MALPSLTKNGLAIVCKGIIKNDPGVIVQVINLSQLGNKPGRYRITISDGEAMMNCVLDQSLTALVANGSLAERCLIKLTHVTNNPVSGKQIILIFAVEIVNVPVDRVIGKPESRTPNDYANQPNPAPAPAGPNRFQPQQQNSPMKNNAVPQANYAQPQQQSFGANGEPITPIKRINLFNNKWMIKAKVMTKAPLKNWSKDGRTGQLFSVDLIDADGGEIRASCFNETALKLEPILQEGQTYYISKGTLKAANKRFSTLNNEYEITLSQQSEVVPCEDDTEIRIQYNTVPLEDLVNYSKDTFVDVIGLATETTPVLTRDINGRSVARRTFKLMNSDAVRIEVTLWDDKADNPGWNENETPVLAIKGAKVSEFGGRSLNVGKNTRVEVNPNISETSRLRQWFESQGGRVEGGVNLSNSRSTAGGGGGGDLRGDFKKTTFASMIENYDESNPNNNNFELRAWINNFSEKEKTYPSCAKCKKKIQDTGRCVDNHPPQCIHRYILQFAACDSTGHTWLGGFDDVGRTIFGCDGDQWVQIEGGDEAKMKMADATCKPFRVLVRARKETYNEQSRVRYRIEKIEPVDFVQETRNMLQQLKMSA
ncbi:replication protein A 70 kDa DNA-binding subunit [Planoprotostelium fungivorum]|uniref:Replication protein A subunit n=1 Tax=Planoprotostelium fungivorum TaxID=1890364 RepID=A0A2P6N9P5_9EUKA|nr:replication protein A 70 kDa DNA-binding subunit [Planoprotostelium fungivorum]